MYEFERLLAIDTIIRERAREQKAKKKKRNEEGPPVDREGVTLKLGQTVEATANGKRIVGRICRIGKRVSIEIKNKPILVRAFHNVRVLKGKK